MVLLHLKYFFLNPLRVLILLLTCVLTHEVYALSIQQPKNLLPISDSILRKLKKGIIITHSEVKTEKNQQSLTMKVIGLHKRGCALALPKLALYENYYEYLNLVRKSIYNDQSQNLFLIVDHELLPFRMSLMFKLPRISTPGHYQFSFERGFLKGLIGKIHIKEESGKCLMMARADWIGPVSKIPDTVFEMFTTTLSRLTVERLFTISRTL